MRRAQGQPASPRRAGRPLAMRWVRFLADGRLHEGQVVDGHLLDEAGRSYDPEKVVWFPPVIPTKVVGFALTYADHAEELGVRSPEQLAVFFKPPSALVGHRAPVIYPAGAAHVHYEVELAAVIGRRCRRVRPGSAFDVIRGYTIANDVTVRDYIANFYRPPVKAKGWDTFGPLGPYLVEGEIEDPHRLELRAFVNGELCQRGNTSALAYSIPELVAFLTEFMTLEPGDVILTGTPKGISPVHPGDVMRMEIDGLGALENPVIADQ